MCDADCNSNTGSRCGAGSVSYIRRQICTMGVDATDQIINMLKTNVTYFAASIHLSSLLPFNVISSFNRKVDNEKICGNFACFTVCSMCVEWASLDNITAVKYQLY